MGYLSMRMGQQMEGGRTLRGEEMGSRALWDDVGDDERHRDQQRGNKSEQALHDD